jgi:hypothetical protein
MMTSRLRNPASPVFHLYMGSFSMLTDEQREQFMTDGFVLVRNAFDPENSVARLREACAVLGYNLDDPETWTKEYDRVPTTDRVRLDEFAPTAWQVSCDLMGGAERVKYCPGLGIFAVNFRQGADAPYRQASAATPGWHKDGWQFKHFLDSPDQGLLGIPLITDVFSEGGGTFIAADSVGVMARYLAEHPEGIMPGGFDTPYLLSQCHDFREITGKAGDFYVLHPYMMHAVSQNRLRKPRAICNILYVLNEPMDFNRPNPADYSPVEAAILRGLGVSHYDFAPTTERLCSPDGGPLSEMCK